MPSARRKLVAVVAFLVPRIAGATTFEEFSSDVAARPIQQLTEMSCDVAVELRGAVATIEMRQRIINSGSRAMAVRYEHELPEGAVVTGFALRGPAVVGAVAVDSSFRTALVDAPDVIGADPGVLRKVGRDRYEVVLQPIPGAGEVALITNYTMVATPRAGALHLALRGRTSPSKLAACKGTIRVTPGPGIAVRRIRVANTQTAGVAAPFVLGELELALDVELEVVGKQPVVWSQTQPLGDGWNASLVTVLAPRLPTAGARRVVFVIDGSRSMELVGRHNVARVVAAIGGALPAGCEIEAIVYDRTAARVFDELRPADAASLAAIQRAIERHAAANGSDIVGAFALAHQVIAGAKGQAMVIVVTDGVTGQLANQALTGALASTASAVDARTEATRGGNPTGSTGSAGAGPRGVTVHAIVLDPATTRSPGANALRAPIGRYGGAFVEVDVDQLDGALSAIDEWLRPSWLELELAGGAGGPTEVRAGGGFSEFVVHRGAPSFTLTGHGDAPIRIAARPAPVAPIAALALVRVGPDDFPTPDAQGTFAKAVAANVAVDDARALAVLSTSGRIASSRRATIVGGGRYERLVELADPPTARDLAIGSPSHPATAIARATLERLFRDQLQPKARACYQRALGRNASLAGTVRFELRMGRGEVTEVRIHGLGDVALDGCLVDAAYALTPPAPDFATNADDQTIANYPLTFSPRSDQSPVVLGDADSSSPIDIDAVVGGVPGHRKPTVVDSKTPLGTIRPTKSP